MSSEIGRVGRPATVRQNAAHPLRRLTRRAGAVRESMLRRWGTPEDVAGAVRWLASPAATFVTGQVIAVNGGFRRA